MPRSPAHPPVPTGCSRPSRKLLLAGDSTRDYESGGQEFESLRARTFGTVVLAEPGRYCAQPCHTLIASLSNTACAGAPLLYRFRTGRQTANVPCTSKISATRLATPRRICLIGGIRRENRSGPMATGKRLKAAILARRAKGPRKKRTRPKPRQYTHCRLGARTRPGSGGGAPNRQRPHEQS